MAVIDTESLLAQIPGDDPCGEDVEGNYDPDYTALANEEAGWNEPRAPEEEPDWRDVMNTCLSLLERSKHLRVALWLALAGMCREGIIGLRDGLVVVRGFLDRHWEGLYPRLDPDFDNDPGERQRIVEALAAPVMFVRRAMGMPVCPSGPASPYTLRDCLVARGEEEPPPGYEGPPEQWDVLKASIAGTDVELLQDYYSAVCEALEQLEGIRNAFAENAGPGTMPELKGLESVLTRYRALLGDFAGAEVAETAPGAADTGGEATPQSVSSGGGPAVGAIGSRADVRAALDSICRYYEQNDPSSPVPLLLKRARRLVDMNFTQIIQDLAPGAMTEINQITGVDNTEGMQ